MAGDAAVPAAGPAELVAFAGLQVELDLEGGVALQVEAALVATVASGHSIR
jgi:hypothetical protein